MRLKPDAAAWAREHPQDGAVRDSSAWPRQAARTHLRFRARFEPQRLFERARVYELLASLNRKARQAEGTRMAAPAGPQRQPHG